jgi:hypothetical protein
MDNVEKSEKPQPSGERPRRSLRSSVAYNEEDFLRFREVDVGEYKKPIDNGIDTDLLPATRLENGGTPTVYLQSVYDKFNIAAITAHRADAISKNIPTEVTDLIHKESEFFFTHESLNRPRLASSLSNSGSRHSSRHDLRPQIGLAGESGHSRSMAFGGFFGVKSGTKSGTLAPKKGKSIHDLAENDVLVGKLLPEAGVFSKGQNLSDDEKKNKVHTYLIHITMHAVH